MSTYSEILRDALALPPHERLEMAEILSATTDAGVAEPEISSEWREEIARRGAAYERGEVKGIPWEQVRDEVRRKYQR